MQSQLRREVLGWLRRSSTVKAPEFELLEWFFREAEVRHSEMRTAEEQYIADQQAAGDSDINDSGVLAVKYYLRRVRYSQVIQLVSLLEECLESACEKVSWIRRGRAAIPFDVSELKGDQWSVKRKFLERYLGFEVPEPLGEPVKTLLRVRNIIVHNNGKVGALKHKEPQQIKGVENIEIDNDGRILLEPEFLWDSLEHVKAYVAHIDAALANAAEQALAPRAAR